MFTNAHNGNCNINPVHTGTTGAIRVGGIHVKGYKGSIIQADGNRFNIAETPSAGGTDLWNSTTAISTTYSGASLFNGNQAYQAYFEFNSSSDGFIGGDSIVGGIVPSYAMLIAVPLTIKNGSKFKAPKDELRIRHNATIENGDNFDNSHQGTVVLSNRSGGLFTRDYYFGAIPDPIHFWNLKVSSAVKTLNFSGGVFVVDNNYYSSGVLGILGGASLPFKMNAASNTEMHVKHDIIIANTFNGPTYSSALAYGNLLIVMNGGNYDQRIEHTYSNLDFTGNLPALRIEKTNGGNVIIDGPVTINNFIEFIDGLVIPNDASTSQNDLLIPNDLFVVNTNCTVLACSDDSYCNGPIRCRTGKSIELPIGKAGYHPAIIDAITGVNVTNTYTAEYFGATTITGATPTSNLQSNLNSVSNCEVWAIQKANTTDSYQMDLSLSFDNSSCTDFYMKIIANS